MNGPCITTEVTGWIAICGMCDPPWHSPQIREQERYAIEDRDAHNNIVHEGEQP